MGNLHCGAYWSNDGLPFLASLHMGYLHWPAYWYTESLPILWWATFSAEPADGLPSLSSLLIYWWATSLGEPTYELPSLSSLLMRWTHCHPDVGLPPLKSIHMDYTVPHGLAYWLAAFPLEPTRQWCDLFLFWIVYKSMCTNNFID